MVIVKGMAFFFPSVLLGNPPAACEREWGAPASFHAPVTWRRGRPPSQAPVAFPAISAMGWGSFEHSFLMKKVSFSATGAGQAGASPSACGLPSHAVIDLSKSRVQHPDAEWQRLLT